MIETQEKAIQAIQAQQVKLGEYSPARTVAEHLKAICRADPKCAEILLEDLRVTGKGIVDAEKQIKARADEIHKRMHGPVSVPPWEAEDILRKFYGLPERCWGPGKEGEEEQDGTSCGPSGHLSLKGEVQKSGKIIDLADFF